MKSLTMTQGYFWGYRYLGGIGQALSRRYPHMAEVDDGTAPEDAVSQGIVKRRMRVSSLPDVRDSDDERLSRRGFSGGGLFA